MRSLLASACGCLLLACLSGFAAEPGNLRVGAARIDITPAEDAALPMSGYAGRTHGFEKIHDRIYARAIVVEDGATRAAILTWELINVPHPVWEELSVRIEKETGIPAANVLIAAVHDHSAPGLRGSYMKGGPATSAYTEMVEKAAVDVIRRAQANLQPGRVGAATGLAYVNVNRREFDPKTKTVVIGKNPEGPCDRTVAVVRFDDLDGKPIALFINYPVHAVVMGQHNYEVSGDIAGATSRFVEQFFNSGGLKPNRQRSDGGVNLQPQPDLVVPGREVVALWSSGAAGDLNTISVEQGSDFTMVNALGRLLGEEAVRVAGNVRTSPKVRIATAQRTVTCPGKKTVTGPNQEVTFEDADPALIRLSLVALDDIALAGVSGEVLTSIGLRLKKESPLRHTMMVTHANGSSGYIPDDAAYDQISYEISSTRMKRGCAEGAIVNGFLEMMGRR